MTSFLLRTAAAEPLPADARVQVLDVRPDNAVDATVSVRTTAATLDPPPAARDLFALAAATYVIDKVVPRRQAADAWTRDLHLTIPAPSLRSVDELVARTLTFLTGDRWSIRVAGQPSWGIRVSDTSADAVCLLSGGLDSLAGAINLLASDHERRLLLVGVQDQTLSTNRQDRLFLGLQRAYGDRVFLHQVAVGPISRTATQARSLPNDREETSRSRSILFLAAGLACAASLGPDVPLYMPENGFIGLNVPLIAARSGSASTRTTHPHFMRLLAEVLAAIGIRNPIHNPLRLLTKGEALAQCQDGDALHGLAEDSLSCAHPQALRWLGKSGRMAKGTVTHCGYCYPCLIRRAAMHRVGLDDGDAYFTDVLTESRFADEAGSRPENLRALLSAVYRGFHPADVLTNGPLPTGEVDAFIDLHRRGLAELEDWLRSATAADVQARLPAR